MQRTNIIQLKPNRLQKKVLKECMLLSSCVYNMANYNVRQSFFKGEKVLGFHGLQQALQDKEDYQLLGRSYALPRIQVYAETNSARFKLIKSKTQDEVGLPKYYKNRKTNTTIPSYLVIDNDQYSIGKHKITIPLSRQMRKKYNIKHFKLNYNGVLRWQGKQQRGQIHYKDGKFYFHHVVEVEEPIKVESKVYAGIDLGVKRLIAIRASNGEEKLIGSKRHFKQWSYYTNLIAEEQAELAKVNRKCSKRLSKLFNLRSKWQNNLYNNLISKAFMFLRRNNVSHIFIGDVKGIRENNDWGRKGNKMLHNYWTYDAIYHKFDNKTEEYGMRYDRDTEEDSSQKCPICGDIDRRNKKDRLFICHLCGHFDHRDIVGATNILDNGMCSHLMGSAHQGETALSRGCSNATA
jgi:putative transposase